jgi:Raf kinase inhibitor-like YbhB/YbcL family protein
MAQKQDPYEGLGDFRSFTVTSKDVSDGGTMPQAQLSGIFGAGGDDESPHLSWSGFPPETRGFAVTVHDPDAPTPSGFWHWAVYGIPAHVSELPTGAGSPDGGKLPSGAAQLRNDAGIAQFLGSAPPPGHGPHRYFFTVHALDTDALEMIDEGSTPTLLWFVMSGHTLARGTIMVSYQR